MFRNLFQLNSNVLLKLKFIFIDKRIMDYFLMYQIEKRQGQFGAAIW